MTLTIRDSANQSDSVTANIVVHPPGPTITNVAPDAIVQSPLDQPVTLTGLGFLGPITVRVGLPGGGTSLLSGTQIPAVTPTSADLLVTFADAGPYAFTVINADGAESAPFGITVAAALELVFDGSGDPRFADAGLGRLTSDSQGNLVGLKFLSNSWCGGGFCRPTTLLSISPSRGVNWESTQGEDPGIPFIGTDIFAGETVVIAPDDTAFVQTSRNKLSAYRDGSLLAGWPVAVGPQNLRFVSPTLVHRETGDAYVTTGPFSAFDTTPPVSMVLGADGSLRAQFSGTEAGGWLEGPGADMYITGSLPYARIGAQSYTASCEGPSATNAPFFASHGSPDGLLGALFSDVSVVDGACQLRLVAALAGADFTVSGWADGWILGRSYAGNRVQPYDPAFDAMAGVRVADGSTWRQEQIAGSAQPIVDWAGTAYLIAQDKSDGLKEKVFGVDVDTGAITFRLGTAGLCATCHLILDPSGRLYLQDLNTARVYRIVADSTLELLFDAAADPRVGSLGLSKPRVDSFGNVQVASFLPGPSYRLHSISPAGDLRWTAPDSGQGISIWTGGLKLLGGASDSTVVHDTRAHTASFSKDGERNAIWPSEVLGGNYFFAPNTTFAVDPQDGTAFGKSQITFSWTTFPMSVFAINADGTLKWQRDFDWGASGVGVAQGPQRNVYTLQTGGPVVEQRLLAFDRDTGSMHCEDRSFAATDLLGNPDGVFSASQGEIFAHDENCQRRLFYSRAGFRATTKAISGGTLILSEIELGNSASFEQMVALSTEDGAIRWRNTDIKFARVSDASRSALYVFGLDLAAGGRESLFVLDLATGQRVRTIPTGSVCGLLDNCEVGVGPNGETYVIDRPVTRIWRVRN